MVNDPQVSQAMKAATPYLFGAALAMIAADCILYLFNWRHAGFLFCLGMFIGLSLGAAEAIRSKKAKKEDVIICLAGAALFGWVLYRNLV